jgi:hypothetical protein
MGKILYGLIFVFVVFVVITTNSTATQSPRPDEARGKDTVVFDEAVTAKEKAVLIQPFSPPNDCVDKSLRARGLRSLSVYYEEREGGVTVMRICKSPEFLWAE